MTFAPITAPAASSNTLSGWAQAAANDVLASETGVVTAAGQLFSATGANALAVVPATGTPAIGDIVIADPDSTPPFCPRIIAPVDSNYPPLSPVRLLGSGTSSGAINVTLPGLGLGTRGVLILQLWVRCGGTGVTYSKLGLRINGDAGANYGTSLMQTGYGGIARDDSSAAETFAELGLVPAVDSPAGSYGYTEVTIPFFGFGGTTYQPASPLTFTFRTVSILTATLPAMCVIQQGVSSYLLTGPQPATSVSFLGSPAAPLSTSRYVAYWVAMGDSNPAMA